MRVPGAWTELLAAGFSPSPRALAGIWVVNNRWEHSLSMSQINKINELVCLNQDINSIHLVLADNVFVSFNLWVSHFFSPSFSLLMKHLLSYIFCRIL